MTAAEAAAPAEAMLAELPAEVLALRAALDALTALDPRDLAAGGTVLALQRELSRVEAVVCRQADAFDVDKAWKRTTAENATAWIATHTRAGRRHAGRRVRLGRALRRMEHVAAAFLDGLITIDHVDALAAARSRSASARRAFDDAEPALLEWARTLPFHQFRIALGQWLEWADDDGGDHAAALHARRRFSLSRSFEGQWFGDLVLDPVGGEILHDALRAITDELFARDWRAATDALDGARPTPDELAHLTRSPAQRRVDALVDLCRRAMTVPAGGRPPKPLFTVLVGEETFARVCEMGSRTITNATALVPWLGEADIERIVFDGPDRVLSVSHRRTFEGALRRAIQVRDRECTDPYCDKPADRCEVDHIRPWAAGGVTSVQNGRLKCAVHNRPRPGPRPRSAGRHVPPREPPDLAP